MDRGNNDDFKSDLEAYTENQINTSWHWDVNTYVPNREECFVEKQNHPKEEEEHSESRESHSDFCGVNKMKVSVHISVLHPEPLIYSSLCELTWSSTAFVHRNIP